MEYDSEITFTKNRAFDTSASNGGFAMFRWPDGQFMCIPPDFRLPRGILLSTAWHRWWNGVSMGGTPLRQVFLAKNQFLIAEAAAAAESDPGTRLANFFCFILFCFNTLCLSLLFLLRH